MPKRVVEMEEAVKSRNFPAFARLTCSDSNQFHAVCLDTSPPIFYMNDTSHRQAICQEFLSFSWHIVNLCGLKAALSNF